VDDLGQEQRVAGGHLLEAVQRERVEVAVEHPLEQGGGGRPVEAAQIEPGEQPVLPQPGDRIGWLVVGPHREHQRGQPAQRNLVEERCRHVVEQVGVVDHQHPGAWPGHGASAGAVEHVPRPSQHLDLPPSGRPQVGRQQVGQGPERHGARGPGGGGPYGRPAGGGELVLDLAGQSRLADALRSGQHDSALGRVVDGGVHGRQLLVPAHQRPRARHGGDSSEWRLGALEWCSAHGSFEAGPAGKTARDRSARRTRGDDPWPRPCAT
jgi:hypothetical protein